MAAIHIELGVLMAMGLVDAVEEVVRRIEQDLWVAMGRGNTAVAMRIERDLWVAMGQGNTEEVAAAVDALACMVAVGAEWGMVGNVERAAAAVGGEQAREAAVNAAVVIVGEMAAVVTVVV